MNDLRPPLVSLTQLHIPSDTQRSTSVDWQVILALARHRRQRSHPPSLQKVAPETSKLNIFEPRCMLFASLIWGLLRIIRCRRHFVLYHGVEFFIGPLNLHSFAEDLRGTSIGTIIHQLNVMKCNIWHDQPFCN